MVHKTNKRFIDFRQNFQKKTELIEDLKNLILSNSKPEEKESIFKNIRKKWLLEDKTLLNQELANDGRQAAAEFDLDDLIQNIDKNRPLRLSLMGVFSELPVPPFVVKEWRSLN